MDNQDQGVKDHACSKCGYSCPCSEQRCAHKNICGTIQGPNSLDSGNNEKVNVGTREFLSISVDEVFLDANANFSDGVPSPGSKEPLRDKFDSATHVDIGNVKYQEFSRSSDFNDVNQLTVKSTTDDGQMQDPSILQRERVKEGNMLKLQGQLSGSQVDPPSSSSITDLRTIEHINDRADVAHPQNECTDFEDHKAVLPQNCLSLPSYEAGKLKQDDFKDSDDEDNNILINQSHLSEKREVLPSDGRDLDSSMDELESWESVDEEMLAEESFDVSSVKFMTESDKTSDEIGATMNLTPFEMIENYMSDFSEKPSTSNAVYKSDDVVEKPEMVDPPSMMTLVDPPSMITPDMLLENKIHAGENVRSCSLASVANDTNLEEQNLNMLTSPVCDDKADVAHPQNECADFEDHKAVLPQNCLSLPSYEAGKLQQDDCKDSDDEDNNILINQSDLSEKREVLPSDGRVLDSSMDELESWEFVDEEMLAEESFDVSSVKFMTESDKTSDEIGATMNRMTFEMIDNYMSPFSEKPSTSNAVYKSDDVVEKLEMVDPPSMMTLVDPPSMITPDMLLENKIHAGENVRSCSLASVANDTNLEEQNLNMLTSPVCDDKTDVAHPQNECADFEDHKAVLPQDCLSLPSYEAGKLKQDDFKDSDDEDNNILINQSHLSEKREVLPSDGRVLDSSMDELESWEFVDEEMLAEENFDVSSVKFMTESDKTSDEIGATMNRMTLVEPGLEKGMNQQHPSSTSSQPGWFITLTQGIEKNEEIIEENITNNRSSNQSPLREAAHSNKPESPKLEESSIFGEFTLTQGIEKNEEIIEENITNNRSSNQSQSPLREAAHSNKPESPKLEESSIFGEFTLTQETEKSEEIIEENITNNRSSNQSQSPLREAAHSNKPESPKLEESSIFGEFTLTQGIEENEEIIEENITNNRSSNQSPLREAAHRNKPESPKLEESSIFGEFILIQGIEKSEEIIEENITNNRSSNQSPLREAAHSNKSESPKLEESSIFGEFTLSQGIEKNEEIIEENITNNRSSNQSQSPLKEAAHSNKPESPKLEESSIFGEFTLTQGIEKNEEIIEENITNNRSSNQSPLREAVHSNKPESPKLEESSIFGESAEGVEGEDEKGSNSSEDMKNKSYWIPFKCCSCLDFSPPK